VLLKALRRGRIGPKSSPILKSKRIDASKKSESSSVLRNFRERHNLVKRCPNPTNIVLLQSKLSPASVVRPCEVNRTLDDLDNALVKDKIRVEESGRKDSRKFTRPDLNYFSVLYEDESCSDVDDPVITLKPSVLSSFTSSKEIFS